MKTDIIITQPAIDIRKMFAPDYVAKPMREPFGYQAAALWVLAIIYTGWFWLIRTGATLYFDVENRFYSPECVEKVMFGSLYLALLATMLTVWMVCGRKR